MRNRGISSINFRGNADGEAEEELGLERRPTSLGMYQSLPKLSVSKSSSTLMKEETGSLFTQRRTHWELLFRKPLTIPDFVTFNRQLARFPQELDQNQQALKLERKLDKMIEMIDHRIFSWEEQYKNVKRLTSIFALVRAFNSWSHFTFINIEPIRNRLFPIKRFKFFFGIPFYSDDKNHFYASAISTFFTNLFWAFLRVYLSFPTGSYSRIEDDLFSLIDPFSREKIRKANRAKYKAEVEHVHGFSIMQLINTIIEKFLITEAMRWGQEPDTNFVVPILTIVNEALSTGLVQASDCQQLMLNLQFLSEALAFIEQSISSRDTSQGKLDALYIQDQLEEGEGHHKPTKDSLEQCSLELQYCKLLISKIVLQLVFVYSDQAFVDVCFERQGSPYSLAPREALANRLQENATLHKSICIILLRYIFSRNDLKVDEETEAKIESNQCMLLVFLTDSRSNFFMDSIGLVPSDQASFYLNDPSPEVQGAINEVVALRDNFLSTVKSPWDRAGTQNLLDILSTLAEKVVDTEANKAVAFPSFTLELAWRGVTRLVLLVADRMNFSKLDNAHLKPTFDLLRRLLNKNRPAQSLLFRGSTCRSYKEIFKRHMFRSMKLLIEVFEEDYVLLNQSYQVFDINMVFYDGLIDRLKGGSSGPGSVDPAALNPGDDDAFFSWVSSLLLFNIFLERMMGMNIKASQDKWRKYDLVLQLKIVDIITTHVLPTLCNPKFLTKEEFAHLDLERIALFKFTEYKASEIRGQLRKEGRRAALYSLYFTFVKLFVVATTFVFPKRVYDEVSKALRQFNSRLIPTSFASSVILRSEMIQLITRFWIFPNNHILYEGLSSDDVISFKRDLIPKNFLQIHQCLESEMQWIVNTEVELDNPHDTRKGMLQNYLTLALLPAVYKMVRAILSTLSLMIPPRDVSNLRYYCERLGKSLAHADRKEKMMALMDLKAEDDIDKKTSLVDLLGQKDRSKRSAIKIDEKDSLAGSLAFLPGSFRNDTQESPQSPGIQLKGRKSRVRASSSAVLKGLQARSRRSGLTNDHSLGDDPAEERYGTEVFEHLLNPELPRCQEAARRVVRLIDRFFKGGPLTLDPLSNFKQTDRKWMFDYLKPKKQPKNSQTKREDFEQILKEVRGTPGVTNASAVIQVVQRVYMNKEVKIHGTKNPLIRFLTTDVHYRKYNYNVASSCISMLANMTAGDTEGDYHRCFFVKQIYADEIRAVNFLMNYSSDLRIQMFSLLKEGSTASEALRPHLTNLSGTPVSRPFLRGLWAIYVNLTLFIYYKTFDDKYLRYNAELNQLVSEFLRNFFMNNFSKFKTYLSQNHFGVTRQGSHQFKLEKDKCVLSLLEEEEDLPHKADHPDEQNSDSDNGRDDSEDQSEPSQSISQSSEVASEVVRKETMENIEVLQISKSVEMAIQEGVGPRDKKDSSSRREGRKDSSQSSDNKPDEEPNETIFMENFVLMAELFNNCSVARGLQHFIAPSDRANLFPVLVQVMNILTEFVTGPCLINQRRIYDKEAYIWIGILNRFVDDVHHEFYYVKLAVLEYLMGLMQGFNHAIIDFMAKQLQVSAIYDVTIMLARLLYVRIRTGKQPDELMVSANTNDKEKVREERERVYRHYDKTNHFETIGEKNPLTYRIRSPQEMLELYRENSDFNSHVIMQIIVHSYVFMRSVGDKVKFWQIFLKQKEAEALNWADQSHQQEVNIIFMFVLKMMFRIEIVYEISPQEADEAREEHSDHEIDIQDAESKSLGSTLRIKKKTIRNDQSRHSRASSSRHSSRLMMRRQSEAVEQLKVLSVVRGNQINPNFDKAEPFKRIQRRFYFQTPPLSLFWTQAMKDDAMEDLPIRSTNRKQVYFYSKVKQLTIEAETHADRVRTFGVLAHLVTPDAFNVYEVFLFLLSLVQNILLMIYLQEKPTHAAFIEDFSSFQSIQIAWALVLTGLSFLVLVLWMVSRWKIYRTLNLKEASTLLRRRLTPAEKIRVYLLDSLIFNPTFSSFMLNFIITLLGFFVYTGIYTLNLFLAVKIFKPMTDVLKAILQSGSQLFSTFQLMTLLIYFFSWVTVLGLTDRIINDYQGPQNCRDLYTCLFNTWNFGLRESGGLGAALNAIQEPAQNRFWLNWVVSISYLVIIKFIVLNIVAGIIIEGFGELRDTRSKREFDVLNFCPICGMDRWESERVGVMFEEHIKKVHNVWNYLMFLVRLSQMSETSLVGFEFDISSQLHYKQTKWFPKNKVLSEENGYEELSEGSQGEESEEEDDD